MQDSPTLTFWESVRQNTKWGSYVTSIEQAALQKALNVVQKPSVALEIGTEGGHWTKMLIDQGWRVICTEVDETALARCRRRLPEATLINVSLNATTLPCESSSVNLIVCFEVFPVIHSAWFYAEAARVLANGGVVVGVTHNKHSPRSYANRVVRLVSPKYDEDPYLYRFTYHEWKQQLSKAGFRLIHEEGMCWLPFPRKSNFFLIPQLTRLEERLGLRRLPRLSPWIAFVARKD